MIPNSDYSLNFEDYGPFGWFGRYVGLIGAALLMLALLFGVFTGSPWPMGFFFIYLVAVDVCISLSKDRQD